MLYATNVFVRVPGGAAGFLRGPYAPGVCCARIWVQISHGSPLSDLDFLSLYIDLSKGKKTKINLTSLDVKPSPRRGRGRIFKAFQRKWNSLVRENRPAVGTNGNPWNILMITPPLWTITIRVPNMLYFRFVLRSAFMIMTSGRKHTKCSAIISFVRFTTSKTPKRREMHSP